MRSKKLSRLHCELKVLIYVYSFKRWVFEQMAGDIFLRLGDQLQAGYKAGGRYLFIGIENRPEHYLLKGAEIFYDREPDIFQAEVIEKSR